MDITMKGYIAVLIGTVCLTGMFSHRKVGQASKPARTGYKVNKQGINLNLSFNFDRFYTIH